MSVLRIVVILSLAAGVLCAVTQLRAETARLYYEMSRFDRYAAQFRAELREKRLALARLQDPALLRDRATSFRYRTRLATNSGARH